ncbi:MAG TPA: hypothetical protein VFD09_08050 [Thiopseudomonas sp.]|nr:hypothetical protein [Thiopseudomonas sp.]
MTVSLITQQSSLKLPADDASAVTELQAQLAQFTRLREQFAASLQSIQAGYKQLQTELS